MASALTSPALRTVRDAQPYWKLDWQILSHNTESVVLVVPWLIGPLDPGYQGPLPLSVYVPNSGMGILIEARDVRISPIGEVVQISGLYVVGTSEPLRSSVSVAEEMVTNRYPEQYLLWISRSHSTRWR